MVRSTLLSHSHGRGDYKEATDVIYDGWQKRYNAPIHPGYYTLWMQVALAIFRTTTSHTPASFGTQTLPREEPTRFQSRLKSPDDFYLEKPRNRSCRWASWAEAVAYGKQPFCALGLLRCNGGSPKGHLFSSYWTSCPIGPCVEHVRTAFSEEILCRTWRCSGRRREPKTVTF